jgi:membrane protease YdiL (CAAX protease family)
MLIGKETAIGPALRVFRHFTERQRFHQLKFQSGERALLLAAGMPAPSVELVRLVLGGVIPWQTVWEYNPTRAGGYGDYVHKLKTMFSPATEGADDSLNYIRDALLRCQSIEEARMLLLQRERLANSSTTETADRFTRHEPRSATTKDGWELGILSPQHGSSAKRAKADGMSHNNRERGNEKPETFFVQDLDRAKISAIPDRYRIREDSQGKGLTCVEAPTVTVRAERGIAISAKQACRYPAGTIFLDGVAQGEPFADTQKEVYSLKHPEGCIRSLATCEQAILLVRKVGDARTRDWVVLANDADLDTIFAVWVLLNHLRLNDDSEVRAKVMPLLRLEGVIDAHGHDAQYLAALPADVLHSTSTGLKQLRQQETVFKGYGRWSEMDLLEYVADRLRAIDELIYSPEDFVGLHEVEELARAEIANGAVAVVCRSEAGIHEVERQLQRVYGPRLGILIFQNTLSGYSVRQIDRTLPAMLQRSYERLNLLDPAVRGGSQNRWDGSTEVGASPRKTGTELTPSQIIEAVREAFREATIVDIVCEIPRAVFLAVAALLPTLALIFVGNLLRDHGYVAAQAAPLSAVALTITVGILFWLKARRVSGLYGWRPSKGFGWLMALPAALVGAVTGGVWAPESLGYPAPHNLYELTAALLFPVGAELLFRGVILGQLASRLPIQKSGGPWWDSWPTLISSALYAASSVLLVLSFSNGQVLLRQCSVIVVGALTFGVASGIARERSESVLSSVLFHCLCVAALLISGKFRF